jgi:hypothetical protein
MPRPIFEIQSSNFSVTGHSAGELNEIVQYTQHCRISEHCVPRVIPARTSLSRLRLGPQLPHLKVDELFVIRILTLASVIEWRLTLLCNLKILDVDGRFHESTTRHASASLRR